MVNPQQEREKRELLGTLHVLVADRNDRTAALVRRILFSFGFRNMHIVTSGAEALKLLASEKFDLIITELEMSPVDGIELVRAIRSAQEDKRIRRDIPIIMLTAHTEINNVELARDTGITEFLAKPFSAKTISTRIIQIIDNPRAFVESPSYTGPCRRRRTNDMLNGKFNRRLPPELRKQLIPADEAEKIIPPDTKLKEQFMPLTGSDLLNDEVVAAAQEVLMQAEGEFIEWAKEYIAQLEHAYTSLCADHEDKSAAAALREAAYAINSQAGIFGYDLGTQVGDMLVKYLSSHPQIHTKNLIVIRKHMDAVNVIFREHIKESGQQIGADLLVSLQKLIIKLDS